MPRPRRRRHSSRNRRAENRRLVLESSRQGRSSSSRRQRVPSVNADHADRVVMIAVDPEGLMVRRILPLQPRFEAVRREQLHGLESHLDCELQGSLTGHRRVARLLHHQARDRDRILDFVQVADGARAVRRAVHDARVELDLALRVRQAAVADLSTFGIVLGDVDALFDGIEQRAAARRELAAARAFASIPHSQVERKTGPSSMPLDSAQAPPAVRVAATARW